MAEPSEDAVASFRRNYPEPQRQAEVPSQTGGPSDTSGGMNRVWEKLAEHDKRFDRIEAQMTGIASELSNAKFWFVGTALAISFAGLGLVYAARQDTTATIGAALSAIQTVVSVKQEPAAPAQPTVIIVPSPYQGAPAPLPAPKP